MDEAAIDRYAEECVHAQRLALNAELEHPRGLLPWAERDPMQQELDRRIASAVAVQAVADAGIDLAAAQMRIRQLEAAAGNVATAERERIAQLATRKGAICTSDEGPDCYFAILIKKPFEIDGVGRKTE